MGAFTASTPRVQPMSVARGTAQPVHVPPDGREAGTSGDSKGLRPEGRQLAHQSGPAQDLEVHNADLVTRVAGGARHPFKSEWLQPQEDF